MVSLSEAWAFRRHLSSTGQHALGDSPWTAGLAQAPDGADSGGQLLQPWPTNSGPLRLWSGNGMPNRDTLGTRGLLRCVRFPSSGSDLEVAGPADPNCTPQPALPCGACGAPAPWHPVLSGQGNSFRTLLLPRQFRNPASRNSDVEEAHRHTHGSTHVCTHTHTQEGHLGSQARRSLGAKAGTP